jgi:hypothetical protein
VCAFRSLVLGWYMNVLHAYSFLSFFFSPCSSGGYNDHDDLVFTVAESVSPPATPSPSKMPVTPAPVSSAPSKKPTPKVSSE